MNHPHSAAHILPLLRRMDANFGGAWSREDIDVRSREWGKQLAAAPMPAVEAAVDHLIATHEGHYPKVAQVRRVALELANRNGLVQAKALDESCPTCGEIPRPHKVLIGGPNGRVMERLVWRHTEGRSCARFNAEHRWADEQPIAQIPEPEAA